MSGVGPNSISRDVIVECLDEEQRTLARRLEQILPSNGTNGRITFSARQRVNAIFLYLDTYIRQLSDSIDPVQSTEVINTVCRMIHEATAEAAEHVRGLAPSGGFRQLRSQAQTFNAAAREFERAERVAGQKIRALFGLDDDPFLA